MKYIQRKVYIFIPVVLIFVLGVFLIGYFYQKDDSNNETIVMETTTTLEITSTSKIKKKIYVDVKGAVKKPGVYEVEEGAIVNDCIKLAGGLASGATTKNINLSKKVFDEMVIYIFKASEITTTIKNEITCVTEVIEINNCEIPTSTTNTTTNASLEDSQVLININTASKDNLLKIPGIGESKADAIIKYREKGTFKTIEDIKNVSGIGESLFAKIKDYITV